MKIKVRRHSPKSKSFRVYLPEDVGKKFEGDAECLVDAITITIVKPNTPLEQIEHSLEIMLDDTRLKLGKSKLRDVLHEKLDE